MKIGGWIRRPTIRYQLGKEILQESGREKDLGVDITPDLSPGAHVKRITSAEYARMANFITAFRYLCKESFRTFVFLICQANTGICGSSMASTSSQTQN